MSKHFDPAMLPDNLARFAQAQVAEGRFASIEEVISAGVEALQEREEAEQEWLEVLRERWVEGDAAVARGDYFEGTPKEIMARVRARIEKNS